MFAGIILETLSEANIRHMTTRNNLAARDFKVFFFLFMRGLRTDQEERMPFLFMFYDGETKALI